MDLLLDTRGLILSINPKFTTYEEDGYKFWKSGTLSIADNSYKCVTVESVPVDVTPSKYFYLSGEFILNPNWNNATEEIIKLQKENTTLKTDLSLLQEVVNEMLLGV
jgi:hypothetical protein|nr:MAG TPA: hypothetical protein [Caudoviricetes sp.]